MKKTVLALSCIVIVLGVFVQFIDEGAYGSETSVGMYTTPVVNSPRLSALENPLQAPKPQPQVATHTQQNPAPHDKAKPVYVTMRNAVN